MPRPYQPSLLRLLHAPTALVVAGCWLSGLLVYLVYDGRWARLPLAASTDWIDVHGSLGVLLVLVFCVFAPYALTVGRVRLLRLANALPLAALTLSIGTGLLMSENSVRAGELDTFVYRLHLAGWLGMGLAVAFHLAAVFARGGWPLARSMFSLPLQRGDRPADWPDQLRRAFRRSQ
ncbi:MAG: cytochrome B [Cyanobacteriota bacterium]|jgi:hypothetical protein